MNSDDTKNNSTPSYEEVEAAYAKAVEEQDAFASIEERGGKPQFAENIPQEIPTRPDYSNVNTASAHTDEPIPNSELSIIFEALHFASKFINEWLTPRINDPETTIPSIDEELNKQVNLFLSISVRTAGLSLGNGAFFRQTAANHVADFLRNYVTKAKQQQQLAELMKQQQQQQQQNQSRIIGPDALDHAGGNMFQHMMDKFRGNKGGN